MPVEVDPRPACGLLGAADVAPRSGAVALPMSASLCRAPGLCRVEHTVQDKGNSLACMFSQSSRTLGQGLQYLQTWYCV